jgi:hypothetical protein
MTPTSHFTMNNSTGKKILILYKYKIHLNCFSQRFYSIHHLGKILHHLPQCYLVQIKNIAITIIIIHVLLIIYSIFKVTQHLVLFSYSFDYIFVAIADRANRDYQNGNYERAEHYCLQLYQQEPDNTSLLLLLSSIYFQMRRYDQ